MSRSFDTWETEMSGGDPPPLDPPGGGNRGRFGGGDDDENAHDAALERMLLPSPALAAVLAVVCLAAMFVCGISIGVLWL